MRVIAHILLLAFTFLAPATVSAQGLGSEGLVDRIATLERQALDLQAKLHRHQEAQLRANRCLALDLISLNEDMMTIDKAIVCIKMAILAENELATKKSSSKVLANARTQATWSLQIVTEGVRHLSTIKSDLQPPLASVDAGELLSLYEQALIVFNLAANKYHWER
jgi:hypothetical protein